MGVQPSLRIGLPSQIERTAIGRQHLARLQREAAHQRGSHHAAMAGNENPLAGQIERQVAAAGGLVMTR